MRHGKRLAGKWVDGAKWPGGSDLEAEYVTMGDLEPRDRFIVGPFGGQDRTTIPLSRQREVISTDCNQSTGVNIEYRSLSGKRWALNIIDPTTTVWRVLE